MGWFSGKRPDGLGFHTDGKAGGNLAGAFKPCSWKPNCVNSTADQTADAAHYIRPLNVAGDAAKVWAAAVALVKAAPRVSVVTESATYLYVEYRSKAMGYVDDIELFRVERIPIIRECSYSFDGTRHLCNTPALHIADRRNSHTALRFPGVQVESPQPFAPY